MIWRKKFPARSKLDEVAELDKLGSDVSINIIGGRIPRTVKVTADLVAGTPYQVLLRQTGSGLKGSLTYQGVTYDLTYNNGPTLLLSKDDTFIVTFYKDNSAPTAIGNAIKMQIKASTVHPTELTTEDLSGKTLSLTADSTQFATKISYIMLPEDFDLAKQYKVTLTTTGVTSGRLWSATVYFGSYLSANIRVDEVETTANDKNVTVTQDAVKFSSRLIPISYYRLSSNYGTTNLSVTVKIEEAKA